MVVAPTFIQPVSKPVNWTAQKFGEADPSTIRDRREHLPRMAKTAPDYPKEAREAFLEAHCDRGEPWTRVVKLMRTGQLTPSLPAYPKLSYSTARRWKDLHERQLVEALPPDLATWQKIADAGLKVLAREVQKLERDSKKPAPIEANRLRGLITALKEARPLAAPNTQEPDTSAGDQEKPASLLESLAAKTAPRKPDPIEPDIGQGTTQPQVASQPESEEPNESGATSGHAHIAGADRLQPQVA